MDDLRCTISETTEERDVLTSTTNNYRNISVTAPTIKEARKHFNELRKK